MRTLEERRVDLIVDPDKLLFAFDYWRKVHAPWAATEEGWEILLWLRRSNKAAPRPLTSLYLNSDFSEPTVRLALKQFIDAGVVVLVRSKADKRQQLVATTEKFDAAVALLGTMANAIVSGATRKRRRSFRRSTPSERV